MEQRMGYRSGRTGPGPLAPVPRPNIEILLADVDPIT